MPQNIGNLPDRELLTTLQKFNTETENLPTTYGLTTGNVTLLGGYLAQFALDLDAWDAVQDEYDAKRAAKNFTRQTSLKEARLQIKTVRAKRDVPDALLEAAGLDLYDKVRTNSPAPTTAPIGIIEYGKLKHTIYFRDAATPDDEAKPKGMLGCEIWRFIGAAPPASENDYEFVTLDTASPYVAFYEPSDAGKKVFYFLRWKSKNGETGEWSETVEATING